MSIKAFCKLAVTGLVLCYPLLTHWALPLWPGFPPLLLTLLPAVFDLWLAWMFGSTLQAEREPLISSFARIERQEFLNIQDADLPVDIADYTRTLTRIWTSLFLVMAIIVILLALSGKTAWWAIFTGIISYLCVTILFIGEYVYRLRRFPAQRHANPLHLAWLLIKSGPIWLRQSR